MSAKVLPPKHQAACDECGVGVEAENEWAVVRWAVIHNIKHNECPLSPTRKDDE